MKHLKIIICILIILNLFGCTNYEYNGKENIINENKIVIDKIHINHKYTISSIDKKVNGIVMFKEYGRPNIDDSNTIIGAHSGYGKNVYFNDLNRLEVNDSIKLYFDNKFYEYNVTEIKEVDDTDLTILNSSNESILTLLTCKIKDNTKRIVVIAKLNIDL